MHSAIRMSMYLSVSVAFVGLPTAYSQGVDRPEDFEFRQLKKQKVMNPKAPSVVGRWVPLADTGREFTFRKDGTGDMGSKEQPWPFIWEQRGEWIKLRETDKDSARLAHYFQMHREGAVLNYLGHYGFVLQEGEKPRPYRRF